MATKDKVRIEDLDDVVGANKVTLPSKDPFAEDQVDPLEDADAFDFSASAPIKEGDYPARVQDMTRGTSTNGNKMYTVKFYIPELKRSLDKKIVLTEAAMGIAGQNLRALGFGPDSGEGTMGTIVPSQAKGRLCKLHVAMAVPNANSTYDGPQITRIMPMDEEVVSYFAQLGGQAL